MIKEAAPETNASSSEAEEEKEEPPKLDGEKDPDFSQVSQSGAHQTYSHFLDWNIWATVLSSAAVTVNRDFLIQHTRTAWAIRNLCGGQLMITTWRLQTQRKNSTYSWKKCYLMLDLSSELLYPRKVCGGAAAQLVPLWTGRQSVGGNPPKLQSTLELYLGPSSCEATVLTTTPPWRLINNHLGLIQKQFI